jgi:galactokinase
MDHAISLAGQSGKALKIDFSPFRIHPEPVPPGWRFLVAHSLVRAEKSAGAKQQYNERRESCRAALLHFAPGLGYDEVIARYSRGELLDGAAGMPPEEGRRFRHVVSEALRVEEACAAMSAADMKRFGELMNASHESLRDDFDVSHPEVDRLVEALLAAGAVGARVTGAGFGGCAVALCLAAEAERVLHAIENSFYASRPQRMAFPEYLIEALPSAGAQVSQL